MQLIFSTPNEGAPKGIVANAIAVFTEKGHPFEGMGLQGFTVWKSKEGKLYATLPSRRYGAGYFDLLRATEEGALDPGRKAKEFVLAQYALATAASAVVPAAA